MLFRMELLSTIHGVIVFLLGGALTLGGSGAAGIVLIIVGLSVTRRSVWKLRLYESGRLKPPGG